MSTPRRRIVVPLLTATAVALTLASDGAPRGAPAVACSTSTVPSDAFGKPVALTGTWLAEDGRYRLRQIGSCLWWVGNAKSTNAFFGSVFKSTATGTWADVASGRNGKLSLTIDSQQRRLSRRAVGGDPFPAANWRRLTFGRTT
jgi:hypothetical protein